MQVQAYACILQKLQIRVRYPPGSILSHQHHRSELAFLSPHDPPHEELVRQRENPLASADTADSFGSLERTAGCQQQLVVSEMRKTSRK